MAIDTNNEKLAVMEWGNVWEPAIPMVSTSFPTQAHKQQLIWDNPSPLWGAGPSFQAAWAARTNQGVQPIVIQ